MKKLISLFLVSILLQSCATSTNTTESPIVSAINNPIRSEEDRKVDINRHPKDLLEFSQVKKGDTVVDFLPGKGYFTKLFSIVVGPEGRVIANVPKEIESAPFKPVESAMTAAQGLSNVEVKVVPLMEAVGSNVDVIFTSQNYHDLHIKKFIDADVNAYNKLLFKMLKPGGYLIVIDHVATSGATLADIEKLHRINPLQVKKELTAAGFIFDKESYVLGRNEDHSKNVFDPEIRGKTDQFVYRFKRP